MTVSDDENHELGKALAASTDGHDHHSARGIVSLVHSSMRTAGARSVGSGRWLADTMLEVATHLPARDLETLRAHHGGRSGSELADALVRNASLSTATVGAVAGAVAGAEELVPPAWLTLPAELVLETLAVVAVEMKLVAELHAVYERPIPGSPAERGVAIAGAWAERRGVTAHTLVQPGGLAESLGRSTRREVARMLQRKLTRRALRNLPTLAPFLAGAVAGAELNRRATRSLGQAVVRDLLVGARPTGLSGTLGRGGRHGRPAGPDHGVVGTA